MKKIVSLLSVVLFVTAVFAQKTINDPNAEKRNVSGFHAVEVSGGIDLYLIQGDEAVAVSAVEIKYRDKIITKVVDGVLKIYYEKEDKHVNIDFNWRSRKLKVYISAKALDALNASGGSDIEIEGIFNSDKMNLDLSGGSDFHGKLVTTNFNAQASGGSDIVISGSAISLTIDVSGGSDFKGTDFVVENCNARANGGSDVSITVNKELSVEASGGSDVKYKGTGLIREIKNSGGGSVKKI
jgi:hypothetical protein